MPIWLSIIIGVVIGFIVVSILKGQLKSVSHKSAAADYQVPGSLQLTVRSDIYLYQNTVRTPKSKPNK